MHTGSQAAIRSLKVCVVGDDVVANLDDLGPTLLESLLEQQGLQGGIQHLPDVFKQHCTPKADSGDTSRAKQDKLWNAELYRTASGSEAKSEGLRNRVAQDRHWQCKGAMEIHTG